jgi:hypothetical protein
VSTCSLCLPCAHGALSTVLSSDRSDRLASSEKRKKQELPLPSSLIHCNISATAVCCLKANISLSPYAYFQVTNPRRVWFSNVAKLASRAAVSAVACPTWRDITQAVGFHNRAKRYSSTVSTEKNYAKTFFSYRTYSSLCSTLPKLHRRQKTCCPTFCMHSFGILIVRC